MKVMFQETGLVLLLFLTHLLPAQTTRRVPADFPSIQTAINAAQEGDTVLVSPGIYYENLQLRGRNIVLSSRFWRDKNPALIEQTIVDGSQPIHADTASCLLIWKGESAKTVIEGLHFRGGAGTIWFDHYVPGAFREGGGILVEFSSPIIRHNLIRNNTVPSGGTGIISNGGGGIRCGDGAPLIEYNRIVHNHSEGYGGGVVLNYCPGAVLRGNIIAHNRGGRDYSGGGFWATGANLNTVVTLQNNVIAYNQSPTGPSAFSGKAGGIWVFSIKIKARGNILWGNEQTAGKQLGTDNASVEARYNCIQDGFPGTGNITADPMFEDTVCYQLAPGSPCADAGSPDAADYDFSANGLVAIFPARGSLRNDIGAYGGTGRGATGCFNPFAGAPNFTRVQNSPVTTTPGDSRSVNWVDVDGDHDLDLFISNGPKAGENNFLYLNNGKGGFSLLTGDPIVQDGKPSDGASWADVDNDGDLDCFVVNWYGANNLYYKNKGNGTFEQVLTGNFVTDGGYSETAAWGDYNNDGRLDLYVSNSAGLNDDKRNFFYQNNGGENFTRITTGSPATDNLATRSVNWTDYNNDGHLDLFVTNEEGQPENLYRNKGDGSFAKVTGTPLVTNGGNTISSSWGDFDNDGDQDVYLANDKGAGALFRNDNNGATFVKMTSSAVSLPVGNSFGSQWADVDNDSDLDLFVTNAFGTGLLRNYLFINDGAGNFSRDSTEVVGQDPGWSYGCAWGDFDRDGDLDLAVANCFNATQPDYLYENHAAETTHHWFEAELVGTKSNRSAIGAKLRLKAMIGGKWVEQMREISTQTGYCGQNQLAAHFGLGDATMVESVTVQWPSGLEEVFGHLAANQHVTIVEGQGLTPVFEPKNTLSGLILLPPVPNPFGDSVSCRFELTEMADLSVEVLNMEGKLVRRLWTASLAAGSHELVWDGKTTAGGRAPAGQYVILFRKGEQTAGVRVVKM